MTRRSARRAFRLELFWLAVIALGIGIAASVLITVLITRTPPRPVYPTPAPIPGITARYGGPQ